MVAGGFEKCFTCVCDLMCVCVRGSDLIFQFKGADRGGLRWVGVCAFIAI